MGNPVEREVNLIRVRMRVLAARCWELAATGPVFPLTPPARHPPPEAAAGEPAAPLAG